MSTTQQSNRHLLIIGAPGTGKTTLLRALAKVAPEQNVMQYDIGHTAAAVLEGIETAPSGTLILIEDLGRFVRGNWTDGLLGRALRLTEARVVATAAITSEVPFEVLGEFRTFTLPAEPADVGTERQRRIGSVIDAARRSASPGVIHGQFAAPVSA